MCILSMLTHIMCQENLLNEASLPSCCYSGFKAPARVKTRFLVPSVTYGAEIQDTQIILHRLPPMDGERAVK